MGVMVAQFQVDSEVFTAGTLVQPEHQGTTGT